MYTLFLDETVVITVYNPTLEEYQDLEILHRDHIRCPCTMISSPHHRFVSLSPRFHQICTSDLLDKRWISFLEQSKNSIIEIDWRNRASSQLKLLSDLCRIARKTVNNSMDRFLFESFVSADLVPEIEFSKQINLTLQQFFQSTIYSFDLLNQLTHLLMQVDQPFMVGAIRHGRPFMANLLATIVPNGTNGKQSLKVLCSLESFLLRIWIRCRID